MREYRRHLMQISLVTLAVTLLSSSAALADTRIPVPGGKPIIIITPPNQNALTPADKNWGRTSFSLIDKMGSAEAAQTVVQDGPKGSAQAFTRKSDTLPSNATVVNSGDDEAGTNLLPVIALPMEFAAFTGAKNANENALKIAQASESSPTDKPVVIHVNANRSAFVVFTTDRQCASGSLFGYPGTLLMGTKGTILSTDGDKIILHCGRLLAATANADFKVSTRDAGVKIARHSAAIVDYRPGASFQTLPLYLGAEGYIKVKTSEDSTKAISLKPLEKYVWDVDGNGPRAFDPSSINKDPLIQHGSIDASLGSVTSSYRQFSKQLDSTGRFARTQMGTTSSAPVRLLASDGTEFMVNTDGSMRIFAGWIFVHGPANTAITCAMGTAVFKQAADATIQKVEGYFRVGVCSGSNSVNLLFDQVKVPISMGEEVLLTDHDPSVEELQAGDGVLRRHLTKHPLKNQVVVLNDFSIFSLMYNGNHLSALRTPKNSVDRSTREHLLKNMAAIQFSTTDRGEYTDQPRIISVVPTEQLSPDSNGRITISRLP